MLLFMCTSYCCSVCYLACYKGNQQQQQQQAERRWAMKGRRECAPLSHNLWGTNDLPNPFFGGFIMRSPYSSHLSAVCLSVSLPVCWVYLSIYLPVWVYLSTCMCTRTCLPAAVYLPVVCLSVSLVYLV